MRIVRSAAPPLLCVLLALPAAAAESAPSGASGRADAVVSWPLPPPPARVAGPIPLLGPAPGSGSSSEPASPIVPMGTLAVPPADIPARPASAEGAGVLPEGMAIGDYDRAFSTLRIPDYDQASVLLRRFVDSYPTDPLAANAQYWLGEVRMIRGDYAAAAESFAGSMRMRPDGALAERALAKMAVALGRDGRRDEACGAIRRLDGGRPAADVRLSGALASERRRLGC